MTDRPLEIERKFLLDDLPDLNGVPRVEIRQGYITALQDTTEVRLRQSGEDYFLSIKGGEGLVRTEREVTITAEQFEALWPETAGRRVEKTRCKGRLPGGLAFDLDIYSGVLAPLLTVEVEFSSESAAEAFSPPAWFGKDVTLDKRYRNKALAVMGADALVELMRR
ncbi:CYTH domain-containing protein [Paracoccus sp. MBLB3053]|uniref:CYTH domain-containing protein n=1 Tax=Paracoccus aurantius TaxID=3073814 RepID=A0ABU2HVW7_9RHOB|nr:CYTH domain-containing protein [Paracoccus sp. MBLB3053]MDS9469197.1 CYTH domain-containing protein [Paracoccus sp. MBLB3053]